MFSKRGKILVEKKGKKLEGGAIAYARSATNTLVMIG